ncbi:MAG TPA: protein-glutamate O-methyltransferase CheR [Vicinamibacterales bacterium]|nr:protein-glutamate O-methyltransferase CheR [Vicinamibacterales bacterium]
MATTLLPHSEPFAAEIWTDLIRRRAGLTIRESQRAIVAELLHARMQKRGATDPASYFAQLEAEATAGEEWTALVERLVSPETSFFRHPESFAAVGTRLLRELRQRPDAAGRSLSLLSAGCSTGQETYSLAMIAAAHAGDDFSVCGVDISRRAIAIARQARYAQRALFDVPAAYRRFVRLLPGTPDVEIDAALRARVRFVALDLQTACQVLPSCDVIFCQNVLIYFAPPAAASLLSQLASRLTLGGYLVPGPGEAPIALPGLDAVVIDGVRMFRRVGRTMSEVRS